MLGMSVELFVLIAFALPFLVGFARFEFPKMEDESYPSFLADTFDKRTLVQGGVVLDETEFSENANGYKYADAGILVGRTSTEAGNNAPFGHVDGSNRTVTNQEEIYILAHDKQYLRENPEAAVIRHGTQIRMDQLPGYGSFTSGQTSWIKDNHDIIPGTR